MKDDAGKKVRILNPNGFAEWPVRGDRRMAIVKARLYAARNGWFRSRRDRARLVVVLLVGFACLPFVFSLLVFVFKGWPFWTPMIGMLAMMFGMVWFVEWFYSRDNEGAITEVLVAEGLCASCGYNLYAASKDAAGRAVCPECGAAWARARIKRCERFADDAVLGNPLSVLQFHVSRRVVDAAGTVVALPMGLLRTIENESAFAEEKSALVRARGRGKDQAWAMVGFGVAVAGVVLIGRCGSKMILGFRSQSISAGIAIGALLILIGLGWNRWWMRGARKSLVDDLLAERMCPGCFSVLAEEVSSSRTTRCACCEVVWRLGIKQRGRA